MIRLGESALATWKYFSTSFFKSKNQVDPTNNFEWEYVLVKNDKIVNAWCMPGGKIAVYTGILEDWLGLDAKPLVGYEMEKVSFFK